MTEDVCLKVARLLGDTAGELNQYDRARKILSAIEGFEKQENVTRFEVIDGRRHSSGPGRAFTAHNIKIELAYQDALRTLKVFVKDREEDDGTSKA